MLYDKGQSYDILSTLVARLKWSEREPPWPCPSRAGCLALSRLREVGTGNDAYVKGARGDSGNLKQRRKLAGLFPGGHPVRGGWRWFGSGGGGFRGVCALPGLVLIQQVLQKQLDAELLVGLVLRQVQGSLLDIPDLRSHLR